MSESGSNFEKYTAQSGDWQGEPVIILRDNTSGSIAMIAPNLGSNCLYWAVQHNGEELPVVESPATPQVLHERGSRAGVPVLFPFPGRVKEAVYNHNGQAYKLPGNEKSGVHHIHGVVLNTAWEVVEYGTNEEGAFLITQIKPKNLVPEFRQGYPFDFVLSLRFVLKERQLTYHITVENRETAQDIPFGFGLHPYLRAPLPPNAEATDRRECLVQLAATKLWELDNMVPTGQKLALPEDMDFRARQPLGTSSFDDVYGEAMFEDGWTEAGYRTPGSGLEVRIRADQNFQNWVLFTPAERPSIAIEPYTCVPDAVNMEARGVAGTNLLKLAAGQSWHAQVILEVL